MPPHGPSPVLFFDTLCGFQRTEALRAAIELDLFAAIAAGNATAAEIAERISASPRGVRILADYLVIIGFLRKQEDRYELTADTDAYLNPSSPGYLGGVVRFLLTPKIKESFEKLTAAVRRGGTAISDEGTVSYDNPVWVEFARGGR